MYLKYFGLKEHPFQITPDSGFLFMSKGHARAKACMDYTIRNRDGFVVITGEVGCGKTTLIRKLLSEFDENILVAKIFQTQLNETEFLQAVLVEFGLNPFGGATKVELMDMLTTFLIESFMQSKQLVLIVDEAQNLGPRVLEEIRLLSGLETDKQKILHVIIVGQPELNEILDGPEMEQLLQRVRLRFHLKPLNETETAGYVAHRLGVAGAHDSGLFLPETMSIIYEYTGGVPRLVNTLCDTALTCAFADDLWQVSVAVVRAAIEELQWIPYSEQIAKRGKARVGGAWVLPADRGERRAKDAELTEHMRNIEELLRNIASLLQRRNHISVRLGRHQLTELAKQLGIGVNSKIESHINP
ncbi:MAG: ExeA family protein [Acidiferrobacteraceae bacterium]